MLKILLNYKHKYFSKSLVKLKVKKIFVKMHQKSADNRHWPISTLVLADCRLQWVSTSFYNRAVWNADAV